MSNHELMVVNGGMCGGCEVCGTREEKLACTGCDWTDFPVDPEEQFAAHLRDVDDEGSGEQTWRGRESDDPWAKAGG